MNATLSGQGAIAIGNVVGSNICNVLLILGISAIVSPLVVSAQLVRFDVPIMIAAAVVMLLVSLDGTVARWEGAILVAALVSYFAYVVYASRRETMAFQAEAVEQAEKKILPEVSVPTDPSNPASPASRRRFQWVVHILLIVAGLGALVIGARWLVAGAVMVAKSFGVSELIIGLTVVAFGTSLPEIATSIIASFRNQRDIAVGNIVGSNIFNVLGILGITAVVHPVPVPAAALAFDLPVMIAVCVACLPIFFIGRLHFAVGRCTLLQLLRRVHGLLDHGIEQARGIDFIFSRDVLLHHPDHGRHDRDVYDPRNPKGAKSRPHSRNVITSSAAR